MIRRRALQVGGCVLAGQTIRKSPGIAVIAATVARGYTGALISKCTAHSRAPVKSRHLAEVVATSIIFRRGFPVADYHFRWH